MSHLEWYPMYPGRFLQSRRVKAMTLEEIGAYQLLLCEQWEGGPIPDDPRIIEGIVKHNLSTAQAVLKQCFDLTDDGWINPELKEIQERQEERHRQKVESGKRGGKRSPSTRPAQPKQDSSETQQNKNKKKETTVGRKRPFPQDWEPNNAHQQRADEYGLDLATEAEKFENRNIAEGKKYIDWDRTFTNWLINAKRFKDQDERKTRKNEPEGVRPYQPW